MVHTKMVIKRSTIVYRAITGDNAQITNGVALTKECQKGFDQIQTYSVFFGISFFSCSGG